MKSKLAYLCSSESWGGLEMNHLRNASWMQERGHTVVFICIKGSPLDKNASDFNLNVIHIDQHKKYYDFKQGRKLVKLLQNQKATHLIVRSTRDLSILAYAKQKLKRNIHTSYFMEMQLGVKKTHLLHSLRYRYIDVWSCPLNWLKEQVTEWTNFKNQLVVIPSGINLDQFSNLSAIADSRNALDLPQNEFIFGLIGRFDEQKGQLLLIEALTKCKHQDFSISLLGEPTLNEENDYFERIKTLIKDKQLEDRVFIRPFRKDAETFYNAINWLVMATKAETFGMVTVESLACGTPVLGSNAGGTPEILENKTGGRLFTSLDSTDLAIQIDQILDEKINPNPDQLKKMAQKYDHHAVCKQVEQILKLA